MKIKVSALALCLILFITFCSVPAVWAASMTPSAGVVGTTVTISALDSGTYSIRWDGVEVKQGTLPGGGSVTFTVPDACGGDHTVTVENPLGTQVLSVPFSVLPSIGVDPDSGVSGDSITVAGKGFAANEGSIKVSYDDTDMKTGITANDKGVWSATFSIPSSAKGSHTVDASGSTTKAGDVPDATLTISPKITLSPVSGGVGTSITVSGNGFGEDEGGIRVTYDGNDAKTGITADSKGAWSVSFAVPSSVKGVHTIDALGASTEAGDVPDVTFFVSSAVRIKPESGYVGDSLTIEGCGFGSNEGGITVTLDGSVAKSNITANSEGCWTTSMAIPASTGGNHSIDAYSTSTTATDVADAKLNVLSKMVIEPAEGYVGCDIVITGTGFGADKELTIKYDDVAVATDVFSDDKGNFQASLEAPKSPGGKHNIVASDASGALVSDVFTMETTPPSLPEVVSPKDGNRVGFLDRAAPTFKWADVSDPSGVYYSLQVSSEKDDFTNTVFSKENLTEPEYKFTEDEALVRGKYYWRIKAVDGADNDSGWTTPILVKIGLMPLWAFIIIAVVAIAFITRLYFFVKNAKRGR
ncbi:MAG: IPT/TIG domain-containing protein [Chloroflexota bacterium]|nr:MAG: IPT/TIG domain-containing protein [Chloroflexota bacterium]